METTTNQLSDETREDIFDLLLMAQRSNDSDASRWRLIDASVRRFAPEAMRHAGLVSHAEVLEALPPVTAANAYDAARAADAAADAARDVFYNHRPTVGPVDSESWRAAFAIDAAVSAARSAARAADLEADSPKYAPDPVCRVHVMELAADAAVRAADAAELGGKDVNKFVVDVVIPVTVDLMRDAKYSGGST